jgi:hypothetical protein
LKCAAPKKDGIRRQIGVSACILGGILPKNEPLLRPIDRNPGKTEKNRLYLPDGTAIPIRLFNGHLPNLFAFAFRFPRLFFRRFLT